MLISNEQKEQIIRAIELKFENILENSLKVIDNEIGVSLSIVPIDESDDDIRQPQNNRRYTSIGVINMFSTDSYSKYVISDIGEYHINVFINNAAVELKGITNHVKEIIFYIIEQCEIYLKIDIQGLFRHLEDEKQVKKALKNILRGNYIDYIEYCKLENDNERFYSQINEKYINYFNKIMTNGNNYSNIIQHLNIISSTPYEGKYNKAKLAIFKRVEDLKSYIIENKNYVIEFEKYIKINNYKSVRKALEMSNDEWAIISDSTNICGLAKIDKIINEKASIIDFTDYFEYRISIDHLVEAPFYNLDKQIGDKIPFKFLYKLYFKYGNPILDETKENKDNESNIIDLISREFEYLSNDEKKNIEDIIDAITDQKKGSMLVISNHAQKESEHLEYQSTLIKPRKLNKEIVEKISCIDGSVLIDEYGICYAIGVILDGPACKYGDKSRGARYNSAIKYIHDRVKNNDNSKHKCIAIVKSEDGMIDVIDRTVFEEEDKINNYNNEIKNNEIYRSDKIDDSYKSIVFEDNILDFMYEEYIKSMSDKELVTVCIHADLLYKALQIYSNEIKHDENNIRYYLCRAGIYNRLANKYVHKFEEYINKALDDSNKSLELSNNYIYAEYTNIPKKLIKDTLNDLERAKEVGPQFYDEILFPLNDILNLDLEIKKDNKNFKLYYIRAKESYILLLNKLGIEFVCRDDIKRLILEDLEMVKNWDINNTDIYLDIAQIYLAFAENEYEEYKQEKSISRNEKSEQLFLTTLEYLDKAIALDKNNIDAYLLRSSIPHKLVMLDSNEDISKRKNLFKRQIRDMEKVINAKNDNYKHLLPVLHNKVVMICERLIKLEDNYNKRNKLIEKRNIHLSKLKNIKK